MFSNSSKYCESKSLISFDPVCTNGADSPRLLLRLEINYDLDLNLHLMQVLQSQSVSGICLADWPGTESNTVNLAPIVEELLKLGQ